MIRITVDKNGKNIKLHYDDNAHKLNEYTQFFKEHMSNLRQKYFDNDKRHVINDAKELIKKIDNIS